MLRPGFPQHTSRLLCMDNFDREDDAIGLGTADIGGTWTTYSGQPIIVDGKAGQSIQNSYATLSCGVTDYRISHKYTSTLLMGVCFRLANDKDYFLFRGRPGSLETFRIQGGTATQLNTFSYPVPGNATLTLEVRGMVITAFIDGAFAFTLTLPTHPLTDRVGVRGSSTTTGAHTDNFVVEVL